MTHNQWEAMRGMPEPNDNETELAQRVSRIMADIEREAEKHGSYLPLVPEQYRSAIMQIADNAREAYNDAFSSDDQFREAIARNWLGKYRVFGIIMEEAGYRSVDEFPAEECNALESGFLTSSGSVLLVGAGAFTKRPGAFGRYVKMPFRERSAPPDMVVERGAHFSKVPRVGEQVMVDGLVRSSPAIAMFVKRVASGAVPAQEIRRTEVLGKAVMLAFGTLDKKAGQNPSTDE